MSIANLKQVAAELGAHELKIMCTGEMDVDWKSLLDLQTLEDGRSLKATDDEKISRLAESLLRFGIVNNLQVWMDENSRIYCFDAHHRKKAFKLLEKIGLDIPPLPTTRCLAENITDAKRLLLVKESRSSWVNIEVVPAYMEEVKFSFSIAERVIDLPELEWGKICETKKLENEKGDEEDSADCGLENAPDVGEIYEHDLNKLYYGDCLEIMRKLPDNSVDTMITDPPYGLAFMGKKWDYDVPGIDVWRECLRVLKPGATALIFAGSRTQHRMAVNVEDAGFILKDTIMWVYGSGFPKSTDISKQLDKMAGKEREVIGKDKNWEKKGTVPISEYKEFDITTPATPAAELWNGWGTALKPAYEPILVAMKPNIVSYAQNALKYGVAGLNIDGGRIEYIKGETPESVNKSSGKMSGIFGHYKTTKIETKGRFPANVILDEESGRLLDLQSRISKSHASGYNFDNSKQGDVPITNNIKSGIHFADKGGASRFFYCAKASGSERNDGCEGLEEKEKKTLNEYVHNSEGRTASKSGSAMKNHHPTVKPLKLIEYLCKLTATPTGGIVIDPFAGSGTTGLACLKTGRPYILIERKPEYYQIAKARLKKTE